MPEDQDNTFYEVIITDEDIAPRVRTGKRGNPSRFIKDHVQVNFAAPVDFIERIDRAATRAGTTRPQILRAMVRQVMDDKSEVVTLIARTPL